jgi:FAD/FMN-containing dehydrogenase/Fe-S oxidoreductase
MNLTVLASKPSDSELTQVEYQLSSRVDCELRFSKHDRLLYSTDASIYQVEPLGVAIPTSTDQICSLLRACNELELPVLPRGGGTSLAGQCTNRAIVIDLAALRRRVIQLDEHSKTVRVETGITPDALNRELKSTGLFFAPDPATVAQAAIGGCIGNNAAGARSIQYGRTSENLSSLELVTASGAVVELGPGAGRKDALAARLAHEVAAIVLDHAQLIRDRFPKTLRRNAGYGLDLILKQLDAGVAREDLDLSGLICGSEGTLGLVTQATLKLHPIPKFRSLVLLSFDSLEESIDLTPAIITTGCCAVELLDDVVLEAAASNNECRGYLELFPLTSTGQRPKAVLFVEYTSPDSPDAIHSHISHLSQLIGSTSMVRLDDPSKQARAWALRKAGEPLLHGIPGHRKPQTFVEDNAVPVENLGHFVRRFKQIVEKHGTTAAYYAHASVGVLHIRPLIDLHDDADRKRMRDIAVEVADLARECGGVMSGEHGDGRIRGPLLERFFGPELMNAFAKVKHVFDPKGILNPTMIVNAGGVETLTQQLRTDEVGKQFDVDSIATAFDYSDQHGFRGAVEMCNGAGVCRKIAGGTMCPSYRGTLDERHSTRGRGNALRLAISGQFAKAGNAPNYSDPDTLHTLDLCLSCKACKSECPSNVDIARLKAEYLHQSHKTHGTPLKARVFGHVRMLNKLGAIVPGVSNFFANLPPSKWLASKMLGIAKQRSLPSFSKSLYRLFSRRTAKTSTKRVVLYADCFATYNDSHIGLAAIEVLEAFGYEVVLPAVECCGRAMISTGLLDAAITSADRTLSNLQPFVNDPGIDAILVLEPSCLASFKDDWLQLKMKSPMSLRKQLAAKSMLVEEFLDARWEQHPKRPTAETSTAPVILHGHCHQKALWGDATSSRLLKRLFADVKVLESGCCGMAGSFGYDAKKYELSMKIGELSVFPPVREAPRDATICAPGTSCRHQIHDGTGKHAKHPIELVRDLLGR